MASPIRGYLSDLGRQLRLAPHEQDEILYELRVHIEDKAQELIESGVSPDEALTHALNDMGASGDLAHQYYEVHSTGSWYHTALAALPHLLFSLMFALHLWTTPLWIGVMIVGAGAISFFGWRMGRPRWSYPWLGYTLVIPFISWGLAMGAVGLGAWMVITRGSLPLGLPIYLVSFAYIAFSLWIVIRFVSRVIRPDWVMASLGALPIPFLAYWFFYFYNRSDELKADGQLLQDMDSSIAIVFLILAAATAIFFRIGRRLIRVALLVITAPSMIVLAWLSYQGGVGYMAAFTFAAISLAALLSPALFDRKNTRYTDAEIPREEFQRHSPN